MTSIQGSKAALWRAALLLSLGVALAVQCAVAAPLWEARKEGATVYLFGSIHVCNAACYPLPGPALRRLSASSLLVVELDPARQEMASALMERAVLPAQQSLDQLLSAGQRRQLAEAAAALHIPYAGLQRLQPWMASLTLSIAAAARAGYSVAQAVDLAFLHEARRAGKPVHEMETLEEQLAAISTGTPSMQLASLMQTVEALGSGHLEAWLDRLVRAWRSGDATRISALLDEVAPPREAWREAVLDRRNLRMAEQISALVGRGETPFVVVGAGHLVGAGSLIEELVRRGYRVQQITPGEQEDRRQ